MNKKFVFRASANLTLWSKIDSGCGATISGGGRVEKGYKISETLTPIDWQLICNVSS